MKGFSAKVLKILGKNFNGPPWYRQVVKAVGLDHWQTEAFLGNAADLAGR